MGQHRGHITDGPHQEGFPAAAHQQMDPGFLRQRRLGAFRNAHRQGPRLLDFFHHVRRQPGGSCLGCKYIKSPGIQAVGVVFPGPPCLLCLKNSLHFRGPEHRGSQAAEKGCDALGCSGRCIGGAGADKHQLIKPVRYSFQSLLQRRKGVMYWLDHKSTGNTPFGIDSKLLINCPSWPPGLPWKGNADPAGLPPSAVF